MKFRALLTLALASTLMACAADPGGLVDDGENEDVPSASDVSMPEDEEMASVGVVTSEDRAFVLEDEDRTGRARQSSDTSSASCPVGAACTFCGPQTYGCYLQFVGTRYSGKVTQTSSGCYCQSDGTWFDWSCDASCGY